MVLSTVSTFGVVVNRSTVSNLTSILENCCFSLFRNLPLIELIGGDAILNRFARSNGGSGVLVDGEIARQRDIGSLRYRVDKEENRARE